ncbi:MAG: cob(I)yrinic acid a,c-diamide adenosyltransferase [Bacteroidetes bacterium]|nr:cob(I)yrinic acid a,c-diamide adenosyltransferase [Bacteroidota bacterium]
MKVYTKTGDKGTTSLIGGARVSKTHLRLEAYGTTDEFLAHLAHLRDSIIADGSLKNELTEEKLELLWIEDRIFVVSSMLASDGSLNDKMPSISDDDILKVEEAIDRINSSLKPLTKFTLPGGNPLVSLSHIARTVCRRAERASLRVAEEIEINKNALVFLNRLSDYLYVLGRFLALKTSTLELYWNSKAEKCK